MHDRLGDRVQDLAVVLYDTSQIEGVVAALERGLAIDIESISLDDAPCELTLHVESHLHGTLESSGAVWDDLIAGLEPARATRITVATAEADAKDRHREEGGRRSTKVLVQR